MDMTLLEKQQEMFKWRQQQQQQLPLHSYVNQQNSMEPCSMLQFQGLFDHPFVNGDMVDWKNKSDMYMDNGNGNLPKKHGNLSVAVAEFVANKNGFVQAGAAKHNFEIDPCLSRTSSFQMGIAEAAEMEEDVAIADVTKKTQPNLGRETSNKRKAESVAAEVKDKKTVVEKSRMQISMDSSKDNQKTDYIHVRARRGQATDSHSIAERARREKISKKMKCLQDLVPGCNNITGRAGMLDEIINYVQSLQRQVEFLSMKLAAQNPRLDFNIDSFSRAEFPAYVASFPTATMSSAIVNLLQQQATCSASQTLTLTSPPQLVPERITGCSGFISDPCLDSSCFPVQTFWDSDTQNLGNVGFHQG